MLVACLFPALGMQMKTFQDYDSLGNIFFSNQNPKAIKCHIFGKISIKKYCKLKLKIKCQILIKISVNNLV